MNRLLLISIFLLINFCLKGQAIIKLQKTGGGYFVNCLVNDKKTSFQFDTGASGILLSSKYFKECLANGTIRKSDIIKGIKESSIASGEVVYGKDVNIRRLNIGDLQLYNVIAHVLIDVEGTMLLGQNVLEKFGKYTFDYDNLTLKIHGDEDKNIHALYEKALNKHGEAIKKHEGFETLRSTYEDARDDWIKVESIVHDFEFDVFDIEIRERDKDIALTFKYDITNLSNLDFKPGAGTIVNIVLEVLTEEGKTIQDSQVFQTTIPSGNTINSPDLRIKLRGKTPKSYRFYCTVNNGLLNP